MRHGQDLEKGIRAALRPHEGRWRAPGRHLAAGRDRARLCGAGRRMPPRRRQDAARRHGPHPRLRQRPGSARHVDQQRGDHRPGAGGRQRRHRHQGRQDRRHRQGRQPGDDGRSAPEADLWRGDHGARCRRSDRHPGRHRRARALRQRATGRTRYRLWSHDDDRRLARARSPSGSTAAANGTWARCCRPRSSGR